ncbi:MAG: hypothetical protein V4792_20765 [Pseudomonadota bacterium]
MSHAATAVEGPGDLVTADSEAPAEPAQDAAPLSSTAALEGWDQLTRQLALLLRQEEPDAAWLEQIGSAAVQMRALAQRGVDAALYLLVQAAAADLDRYSARHAMLCALICDVCAEGLGWPAGEVDTLVRAALTMNLSMSDMQDALARQAEPLSEAQRAHIESHAERSAAMLEGTGVADPVWTEIVRRHRDDAPATTAAPSPPQRMAQLLRRVDVYSAKLSSRAGRDQRSAAIAARDTCIGPDGVPDAIGSAILRALGLYPPGCFVQLANGDFAVVMKRGSKAHTPVAAALRRQDGGMYVHPTRRDTARSSFAVVHGVTRGAVKVRCDHKRNLDCA